jgi:hypothetical protein
MISSILVHALFGVWKESRFSVPKEEQENNYFIPSTNKRRYKHRHLCGYHSDTGAR